MSQIGLFCLNLMNNIDRNQKKYGKNEKNISTVINYNFNNINM